MKLIDALNKIANGTLEDGTIIEHDETYYKYNKEDNSLKDEDGYFLSANIFVEKKLNDEVKIFQEKEEIIAKTEENIVEEFEEIEELTRYAGDHIDLYDKSDIGENRAKINELVRVVNESRRKIK